MNYDILRNSEAERLLPALVSQYGRASASFLVRQGDFKQFGSIASRSIISYAETDHVWVGATDPLCPPENMGHLLEEFAATARECGRSACVLPVSESTATIAQKHGYGILALGSEPWHELRLIHDPAHDLLRGIPTAVQLRRKGAKVVRFDPVTLSEAKYTELNHVGNRWLGQHATVPLGFLNRLEPWVLSECKRYFWIEFRSKIVAYLAAVPVLSRKGWYFGDLVRDPDAPAGAVELLFAEASALLKEEGAETVSLGLSPLARIGQDTQLDPSTVSSGMSRFLFEYSGGMYGFSSLYQFKLKLNPTHWEPQYLITYPKRFTPKIGVALLQVHFPGGVLKALAEGLRRSKALQVFGECLYRSISPKIVPRPWPQRLHELAVRTRAVWAISLTCFLFFWISTDSHWRVRPVVAQKFGYSFDNLISGGFNIQKTALLIFPGFLHWQPSHIIFNLLIFIFLGGLLELIAGTRLLVLSYFVGTVFSNLITSGILALPVRLASAQGYLAFSQEIDLGCSLGVFSTLGALIYFLKRDRRSFLLIQMGILCFVVIVRHVLDLNHCIALSLGWTCAAAYLPKD